MSVSTRTTHSCMGIETRTIDSDQEHEQAVAHEHARSAGARAISALVQQLEQQPRVVGTERHEDRADQHHELEHDLQHSSTRGGVVGLLGLLLVTATNQTREQREAYLFDRLEQEACYQRACAIPPHTYEQNGR